MTKRRTLIQRNAENEQSATSSTVQRRSRSIKAVHHDLASYSSLFRWYRKDDAPMPPRIDHVNHSRLRHARHRRSPLPRPPIDDLVVLVLDDLTQDDDGYLDRRGRDFCATLQNWREALSLTVAEAAERAGISKQRWRCWEEAGLEYKPPAPATIRRLAQALSVFGEPVLEEQLLYEVTFYQRRYEREVARRDAEQLAALHAWYVTEGEAWSKLPRYEQLEWIEARRERREAGERAA